ncbi:MAG TPA: pantetheine-phosphate adenylyltransferase [Salinivirga sp.]|uniref:pantetheine-phosphate adenylyltransferase n=1 Tax=Salinivirga sp. TaxID=1970192 RepID=UPI002B489F89|nr:pantetheine-phosphate adenylyltransferase [Salinivirga sp.]HKK59234.1 pantetheine-phosphate adenylyltransferase [Salinivirga sp.]
MERIAVFPGSFDPITRGHESVVLRAIDLFDKIIIAVGTNANKPGFFPLDKRIEWIKRTFKEHEKIEIRNFEGLTIDFCREIGAKFLLRGIRTGADFEYERSIAQMNKALMQEIETVFILTTPELTPISSTILRDIYKHGGDIKSFIPKAIHGDY